MCWTIIKLSLSIMETDENFFSNTFERWLSRSEQIDYQNKSLSNIVKSIFLFELGVSIDLENICLRFM